MARPKMQRKLGKEKKTAGLRITAFFAKKKTKARRGKISRERLDGMNSLI